MKLLLALGALALFISVASSEEFSTLDATSTGRAMTALAWASYCPFSPIRNWTCYWCNKIAEVPKLQGVQTAYNGTYDIFAYAGISGNTLYVVFRGTSVASIKNWLKDLAAAKVSPWPAYPTVKVHKGFYNAWISVKPLVINLISRLRGTCAACTRIQIVGHSLGGAMATLATTELQMAGMKNVQLYTLGSPRVGDSNFYNLFSSFQLASTRLVNSNDIVPHLAPQALGYHHIATELWYKNGAFKTCDNSGEDPNCMDSVKAIFYSVTDHTQYMGIKLLDGASERCDGIVDNQGPPGSKRSLDFQN